MYDERRYTHRWREHGAQPSCVLRTIYNDGRGCSIDWAAAAVAETLTFGRRRYSHTSYYYRRISFFLSFFFFYVAGNPLFLLFVYNTRILFATVVER